MKIELWAKKIDKGHVKIGEVDVSENLGYEYRLPVKEQLSVAMQNTEITSTQPMGSCRTFRYTPSPDQRALNTTRRYLEE
jgi:hypothetical protein